MTVTRTWIWGRDSYNQKIQTGPTGQSGPPFEVDQSFCETFPVGPNRSIEFWTEISGNSGWMDRPRPQRTRSVLINYHSSLRQSLSQDTNTACLRRPGGYSFHIPCLELWVRCCENFDDWVNVWINTSAPSNWLNSVAWPVGPVLKFRDILGREQALQLGDIVKSRRARGTREETRTRGRPRERRALFSSAPRGFAARSRFLAPRLGISGPFNCCKNIIF